VTLVFMQPMHPSKIQQTLPKPFLFASGIPDDKKKNYPLIWYKNEDKVMSNESNEDLILIRGT